MLSMDCGTNSKPWPGNRCDSLAKGRIEELSISMNAFRMKISETGQIVIPKALVEAFGFSPGDSIDLEISRRGILIQPKEESAESVLKWLKEKHGDEMAALTTNQILNLIK